MTIISEHRPTGAVQVDVFPDTIAVTPRQVAESVWSDVKDWVTNGYQPVIEVTMEDDSTHLVDLADPPERSEDDPHPVIERVTHVRCGTTFTDPFTLDVLNEVDVACPKCSENDPGFPTDASYGVMVWEHRDGTLWETESNGDEVTRHQPIRTHVQVYKSWVNGPEWWIVPRPNTGDIDGSDNLITGYDTYQQALDAITSGEMPATFAELCTEKDGIAWRDRNNPIYQPTHREVNV